MTKKNKNSVLEHGCFFKLQNMSEASLYNLIIIKLILYKIINLNELSKLSKQHNFAYQAVQSQIMVSEAIHI